MNVVIAKKDLWALRELIAYAIYAKESCPNPTAWGAMPNAGRRAYKAIVKAQLKAFGHDWMADRKYFPRPDKHKPVRREVVGYSFAKPLWVRLRLICGHTKMKYSPNGKIPESTNCSLCARQTALMQACDKRTK